ncbi:hypothetical protein FQN55_004302 [Onygenales sp. PD_40]|nr:hypothetical protein FQN55_004302 [Onygenales sp. PD_40]
MTSPDANRKFLRINHQPSLSGDTTLPAAQLKSELMEKQRFPGGLAPPQSHRDRKISRLFRRSFIAICLCLGIYALVHQPHFPSGYVFDLNTGKRPLQGEDKLDSATPLRGDKNNLPVAAGEPKRVPLEAHVMSQCPDARDCLEKLIVPTMVQVHDKVDFRLSFIGTVSNSSSDVACMHGPSECVGDMIILCAANIPYPPSSKTYPKTPTVRSLGFANCMISSYKRIPERGLVEDCALEHGIDFQSINKCASSQEDDESHAGGDPDKVSGIALLRKDFKRTQRLGIKRSCTVRVDEKIWCVRDDGEWTDCAKNGNGSNTSVLVDEIEKLYKSRN